MVLVAGTCILLVQLFVTRDSEHREEPVLLPSCGTLPAPETRTSPTASRMNFVSRGTGMRGMKIKGLKAPMAAGQIRA
jgi:hypothetical protein